MPDAANVERWDCGCLFGDQHGPDCALAPAAATAWDCTTDGVTKPCGECSACKNALAARGAANAPRLPWFKALTPLQRIIVAVCWTAAQQQRDDYEWKRGIEEAMYGRP